jgi:rhodanese-related sulfurtransferase
MHASIMINLTVSDLSRSRSPMILHVKNEYDAPSYNHFILCVPGGNGLVALYDAPQEPVWTTGDELAPLWDGTALAVSTRPIGWNFGYGGVFKWGLGAATFIACAVAGRPRALAFRRRSLSAAGQVAVIVGAAVGFAAVQHRGTSQGYLSQSVAVTAIQSAVFKSSVPLADAGDVESAAGGAGYLVDARTSSDFQAGHIGAAINIPAGASRRARAEAMAGLPRDATLIVYCESSSCPFAPFVARRLAADGFTSVRVFTGGWEQWVAMHRRSAEGM